MKKNFRLIFYSFIFTSIFFVLASPALAGKNPWDVKLPFKQATIEYELTGSATGSETLYIRDYGKLRAKYRKTTQKIMFITTTSDEIEITTPDWIYSIDMKEGNGTKTVNPVKYLIQEYEKLSSKEKKMVQKNAEEMGSNAMQNMEGAIEQNALEILGFKCDKTTAAGTTMYTIHGTDIPLKSESSMMGMNFSTVATKIDKGSVSKDHFTPPENINLLYDKQADDASLAMAKSTMDMLKSPDAAQKMQSQTGSMGSQDIQHGTAAPEAAGQPGDQDETGVQDNLNNAMDAIKGLFGN